MKLFTTLAISIVPAISAFTSTSYLVHPNTPNMHTSIKLNMSTRRDVFVELASGLAMGAAVQPALAETVIAAPSSAQVEDNEIVKEQRTVTDKLDVNNSAVADYMELPGMYPKIGGKIANNGKKIAAYLVSKSLSTNNSLICV